MLIRRLLSMLMQSLIVVAAYNTAVAAPGAATEMAGRGAFIGSTQVPYIFDIVPDPSEPGSVLLATQAGVYRARQDGSVERISRKQNPFWNLSVGGVNGTWLIARGFADDSLSEAVVVSDDQGRSWRVQPSASDGPRYLRVIEAGKASPNVAYAAGHGFWRSIDGARGWVLVGTPPRKILDLAASAIHPQRIFAATFADLYVSEDRGKTWKPTGGARCWQPVMAVDTGTDGAVYAFSLCVGLIRGDESTSSWAVVNKRLGGCIVQHLAVDPRNSSFVYAVLGCHRVLISADGGASWRELGSQKPWTPACVNDPLGRIDADS